MTKKQFHIIGKQFLHLDIPDESSGFELQKITGEIYWKKMLPVIEQLFDKFGDENQLISLNKLELDLGNLRLETLETELPKRLQLALEEKLVRVCKSTNNEEVSRKPLKQKYFQQWIYFLEKGWLPWSADQQNEANRLKAVLDTLGTDSKAISELQQLIKNKPYAFDRLILQHSDDFLRTIVELYTAKPQLKLVEVKKEFQALFGEAVFRGNLNKEKLKLIESGKLKITFWKSIYERVIHQRKKADWQELSIHCMVEYLKRKPLKLSETSYPNLNKVLEERPFPSKQKKRLEKTTPKSSEYQISKEKQEIGSFEDSKVEEQDSFYIQHAGVVLLHAFLPHYFETVGLLKNKQFVNEAAQHRAVHLLQFMATKETTLPEYKLLLPKLLCGIPFNIPISRYIAITTTENEECETMMKAVIDHWKALGKVSTDSLREGFLQREGKLEKRENGWYLIVEKKTQDILLNRLPWNLSMIQLGWMKDMLRVEWV